MSLGEYSINVEGTSTREVVVTYCQYAANGPYSVVHSGVFRYNIDTHASTAPQYISYSTNPARGIVPGGVTFNSHRLREIIGVDKIRKHTLAVMSFLTYQETKTNTDEKGPTKMQSSNEMVTVIQIQQGAKIIAAKPLDGPASKVYHFKNVVGESLKTGDLIVVQVRDSYTTMRVTNPNVRANQCGCALADLKHVVQRVDVEALEAVLESENNAAHALALSEVTERYQTMRTQIGEQGFDKVVNMLSAPTTEEVIDDGK